jgi:hypothetical protein
MAPFFPLDTQTQAQRDSNPRHPGFHLQEEKNNDIRGKAMWNTDFMIGQLTQLTDKFFGRWEGCPTEERYRGCCWREFEWAHEQAALPNIVRYDYANMDNTRVVK